MLGMELAAKSHDPREFTPCGEGFQIENFIHESQTRIRSSTVAGSSPSFLFFRGETVSRFLRVLGNFLTGVRKHSPDALSLLRRRAPRRSMLRGQTHL